MFGQQVGASRLNQRQQSGCLYLVATPIGNLGDITLRAIEVLKYVDVIAVEDTRHSKKLLKYYGIATPTLSLHDYNESARCAKLIKRLAAGIDIALICDAGTPLISDPGYRLVATVHQHGIKVIPVPGACAAIAGLIASGLPTDRFVFVGFLPAKGAARKKQLEELANESRTIIFYESVYRIINLIDLLNEVFGGGRLATIARELTKTFETIHQAKLSDLKIWFEKDPNQSKGEFVIILESAYKKNREFAKESKGLLQILLNELPLKQAVSLATQISGVKRKTLYSLALEINKKVLK